ncbi:fumarylacetoacetate hydrolase family protein [Micromonospora echinofusca]|uniref:Fumarylacetoacetase-like C-terminal domain-containing protein n=1 Tax=Micromonospora echinofusca TaxID=47858 RepID=A0ABS3VUV3_MICEH|nr:fumarylacetoacetate hydrolase family protein [Micromonospora echinofusca]MBO4208319.1 hypothetical protein [Micromonospora echinofusca]
MRLRGAAPVNLIATTDGLARIDGTEAALLDLPFDDVAALLATGDGFAPAHTAAVRRRIPLADLDGKLLAPLAATGAVWGVGLNYHCKARLTGRPVPPDPIVFLKARSAMPAPDADVVLPLDRIGQPDYEGEVAVVVGRRMQDTPADEVWQHIAGITAANDMTARDAMAATGNPTLAKSFAGFGALGASVLDLTAVPDPADIPVETLVNGAVRQSSSTASLIFDVPELLARLTRFVVLQPGDVVLTGTPAGTGQDRDDFLRPGDQVEVRVGGVLPLRTRFVARDGGTPADPGPSDPRS